VNNISDIKLGGLYHIPHYTMAMYDFVDPKQTHPALSGNNLLDPDTPFVALELHTIELETYNKNIVHRIKILTATGEVGWLSLEDRDLPYVCPMTSCDKKSFTLATQPDMMNA
jgi:hypothetical protein